MSIADYRNFDLLITRAGEQYRAFVVDAPAGEGSTLFDLPFAPDDLAGRGDLVRGLHRRIDAAGESVPATSLTDLGSRLFAAIFRDKVRSLLAASLATVAEDGVGLRIRLRFEEEAAGLALLPWELLYDPDQRHFIGLGEQTPILRYLSLPRSRSALLVEPPLRVLAVLASPAGLPALDLEREWQVVVGALAGLAADGKFTLERLARPTQAALQERLLGEPVHILHFVGHGVFDEAAQAGSLALEDEQGGPQLVRGKDLAQLLRNHPAVRLAYLSACEGALGSGQSVLAGVAQALVQGGAPAAVAMQAEISDAGAIDLARSFYTALAAGRPVDAALTQARAALSAAGSDEWAIPVLFSRSPDNRLFDIRQVLPTPACPYPGMVPFSEDQQDLFFGRDREIEEAVERLRQHPFLAVIGPSGSGKSSLVQAGVIPALRQTRRFGAGDWAIKDMRPGPQPLAVLAETLSCAPEALAGCPPFEQRTLLFVDQFEELFTQAGVGEAPAFLHALQTLIGRPNLYLLLTVRADFYPDLMACSLWPAIKANRLELPPLGDDALWSAIVEPAGRAGVQVDEALAVQLIADAAGERGSLPLVQETLLLLWEKVMDRQLGLAAYRGMGEGGRSGLQVAIDRRASGVYDNLPEAAQPIARRTFLRLIQFGEGRADTRRQQTVAELRASGDDAALFDGTLARLVESRLLTASGEAGDPNRRIDISHEALIAGWPRLQEWVGQRKEAEQERRRLEGKAVEWVRLGSGDGGLLDRAELAEAEIWFTNSTDADLGVSADLVALMDASRKAVNPGWHRTGLLAVAGSGVAVIALAALLPVITVGMATPLRSALFLSVGLALVLLLWSSGLLRNNDPYRLQRLSQAAASKRWIQLVLLVPILVSVVAWVVFGVSATRATAYCASQGYTTAPGKAVTVALSATGLDPYGLMLIQKEIDEHPEVQAWIVPQSDLLPCSRFFAYFVEVQRASPPGGTEVSYLAQVRKGLTGSPKVEPAIRQQEQCDMYAEIGQKVVGRLPVTPSQVFSQQAARPQIGSCQAFMRNQEGFEAYEEGDLAKAEELLQEAVMLEPGFATAYNNLGLVHLRKNDYHEARAAFTQATILWPTNGLFQMDLGLACGRLGDYPCAETAYVRSIENEKTDMTIPGVIVEACHNLGMLYLDLNRLAEADRMFNEAESHVAQVPASQDRQHYDLSILRNRGKLCYREGRLQDALNLLLEVKASDKAQKFAEEITYYLALVYEGMGDRNLACETWTVYASTPSSGLLKEAERRSEAIVHQEALDCSKQ